MLKSIKVSNFRCLQNNFTVSFEPDMTVIVGENDAGKTSLVDVLKVIFRGKKVESSDFYYGATEIIIIAEIDENVFTLKHSIENNTVISKTYLSLSHSKLNDFKLLVERPGSEEIILKSVADTIGVSYRSNSSIATLKTNLIVKLETLLTGDDPVEFDSKIPATKTYFLDGKDFEDISSFVNELFFKEKRKNIWTEVINDNITIEDVVRGKLTTYASEITDNINNEGIKDKIKQFMPALTEIAVSSDFDARDLNINVQVKMLENDKEIFFSKKGDGTKRRITMALLDYHTTDEEITPLYVLDEPDTHLHVKAQLELLDTIKGFISHNKQVIITTHSPFLINYSKPQKIRLLINKNNSTFVKSIGSDSDIDTLLRNIGIENIYLFFAKKIILVEGETEERFIPIIYERSFGMNLHSSLIKVMNVKGIKNVPGFARALLELITKDNIITLIDNDADETTQHLINELGLDPTQKFVVGTKEFEDSFDSDVIYASWNVYVKSRGGRIGEKWNPEGLKILKDDCIANGKKFSKILRELNSGGSKKLDKVTLGIALGEFCLEEHLPQRLKELFSAMK
ncbi:MAG: AAA family ATPase [Desulfosporosinus sp.]|nr:AAA family ATPase [Desulfosporosinus sp.]